MAHFLARVFRLLAAFVVAGFIFFIGCVALAMLAVTIFSSKPAPLAEHTILVFDFDHPLLEAPPGDDAAAVVMRVLNQDFRQPISLRDATDALGAAAADSHITGLFLKGSLPSESSGASFAGLRELRRAISAFADSGKPVWAYVDVDNQRDVYLKTAAGQVWMHPQGYHLFRGVAVQQLFIRDTLEAIGIGVQVTHAGKYKSAGDIFVRDSFSPEDREQLAAVVDDLWSGMLTEMADSRRVTTGELATWAARAGIMSARDARMAGLVDDLLHTDEVGRRLAAAGAFDPDSKDFRQIRLDRYIARRASPPAGLLPASTPVVGLIHIEGAITDGPSRDGNAGADTVVTHLRALRLDENCKAVVLRVNTPGGSATAADKILREVALTNQRKPVVVSMGGLCASGGYWLACRADTLFAEPGTITGSIGVIGIHLNVAGLLDKLRLHPDQVLSGAGADSLSVLRPRSERELELLQDWVDRTYAQFISHVAEGRGMPAERVHELAQGRIWSGQDAHANGLIDRLGGLQEAILHAADRAGLGDAYTVLTYPRPGVMQQWLAQIGETFGPALPGARMRDPALIAAPLRMLRQEWRRLSALDDPRGMHAIHPASLHSTDAFLDY
jgi:protease-4